MPKIIRNIDELVIEVTRNVLNEIISHSQIILHDLHKGLITDDTFKTYMQQQPKCGRFLMHTVGQNIANALETLSDEDCDCDNCKEKEEVVNKRKPRKKPKPSSSGGN